MRRISKGEHVTFRLELERGWFYTVHIFAKKQTMWAFRKRLQQTTNAGIYRKFQFEACVTCYQSEEPGEEKQQGVILFHDWSAQRGGISAHEMVHAASFWLGDQCELNINNPRHNERLALITGWLVKDYWIEFYKHFTSED